jgi:putative Holliday junction resolvase
MREEPVTATLERAPRATSATILAFDFGAERVGAAVGDSAIGIAHPLTTIAAADKKGRYAAIAGLVEEWRPALLVVGLPAHLDGTEHEMSRLARKFARELNGRFNLPVELVDERLTSASAKSSLAETGVDTRKRKPLIDQVAAQQILQAYLDEQARRRRTAESRP